MPAGRAIAATNMLGTAQPQRANSEDAEISDARPAWPAAVLLVGCAFVPAAVCYYLARLLGPIRFPEIRFETISYIWVFYAPVLLAAVLILFWRRKRSLVEAASIRIPDFMVQILLVLSAVYVIAAVYDAVVFRKILSLGLSGARNYAIAQGPRYSAIGALNVVLSGAPVVLATVALAQRLPRRYNIWIAALALVGVCCSLLTGGRNPMMMSATYLVTVALIRVAASWPEAAWSKRVTRRFSLALGVFSLLAVAYLLWSFADRGVTRHENISESIQYFADNYKVQFIIPENMGEGLSRIYYGVMNIIFYLAHPIVYLDDYFVRDFCPHTGGAQTFDMLFRFFDFFLNANFIEKSTNSMLLPGIYLSLPGSLYLDFCGMAPLAAVILATVSGGLLMRAFISPSAIPIAAYAMTVLALAPLYSTFTTGNGFSLLVFSALVLVSPLLRFLSLSRPTSRKTS